MLKHYIVKPMEYIRITVRDLDDNILEQGVFKNTITNLLFNLYRDALAGDLANKDDIKIMRLAIGNDDGTILPLAVTNTILGNEIYRMDTPVSTSKPAVGQYQTTYYLPPNIPAGGGWIKEVGWFAGTAAAVWGGGAGKDTGTLIARLLSWSRNKTTIESIQFERLDSIVEA